MVDVGGLLMTFSGLERVVTLDLKRQIMYPFCI